MSSAVVVIGALRVKSWQFKKVATDLLDNDQEKLNVLILLSTGTYHILIRNGGKCTTNVSFCPNSDFLKHSVI